MSSEDEDSPFFFGKGGDSQEDESIDEDTAFTAEDYERWGDIGKGAKKRSVR